MSIVRLIAAAASAALMIGCGSSEVGDPGTPTTLPALTALPRALTPAEQSVLSASNAFTLALWRQVNVTAKDSNVFVSPLSASFSMGMALTGANGQTFDELRNGLSLGTASLSDIEAGYKSLIQLLTSLDPSLTMAIANSIWYRNTFSFNQSFLNDAATYFDATISPLDFSDVNGSLAAINGWVNTKTAGRIPKILDEIRPDNVMFLINAIYFKGTWRKQFDPTATRDAPFHAVGGDQTAHLMNRQGVMRAFDAPTFTAVDLVYGDSAFSMMVLLPKSVTPVESLAASLDASTWTSIVAGLGDLDVDLSLPKFTLSWTRDLIPDMKALGAVAPFTPNAADFTRMSPSGRQLYISSVRQKTFVDVNEQGTEAAAVTSTGVTVTSIPQRTVVRVDRPFVFFIRERLTGAVLFVGKVVRLP